MSRAAGLIVVLAVGVAGAAVMVAEVAGAQALAPHFGTGLNAWVAMITVALGGLALGYALAGRAADRWGDRSRYLLCAALAGAGLACIGAALLWDALLIDRLARLGPRAGALAASAVLFLPLFVLLGAVYPLALKSWTRTLGEVGRRAGCISAVSALGSLVGAPLAGFVLVPQLAIETVFAGSAAVLLAAAAALALAGRGSKPAGLVLLLLVLGPLLLPARPLPKGVLFRAGSMFGPLEVRQDGALRLLMVANTCQGAGMQRPMRSFLPHTRLISGLLSRSLAPDQGTVLLVGLGAGFIPRELDPMPCETVEIDAAVVDAARRFFAFDTARHKVHVADGRAFMNRTERGYAAIVIDALRGADLPGHLLTRECFALARRRLQPGGLLVVNYQGALSGDDRLVRAIEATLRDVFEAVDIARLEEPGGQGNVVFAAHGEDVAADWPEVPGYRLRRTFLDARPACLLTDSRSPVALWCARAECP